jgi:hypothetical protein
MDNREIAKLNCFTAIRDSGAAHTYKFPACSFASGLFARIGKIVTKASSAWRDDSPLPIQPRARTRRIVDFIPPAVTAKF